MRMPKIVHSGNFGRSCTVAIASVGMCTWIAQIYMARSPEDILRRVAQMPEERQRKVMLSMTTQPDQPSVADDSVFLEVTVRATPSIVNSFPITHINDIKPQGGSLWIAGSKNVAGELLVNRESRWSRIDGPYQSVAAFQRLFDIGQTDMLAIGQGFQGGTAVQIVDSATLRTAGPAGLVNSLQIPSACVTSDGETIVVSPSQPEPGKVDLVIMPRDGVKVLEGTKLEMPPLSLGDDFAPVMITCRDNTLYAAGFGPTSGRFVRAYTLEKNNDKWQIKSLLWEKPIARGTPTKFFENADGNRIGMIGSRGSRGWYSLITDDPNQQGGQGDATEAQILTSAGIYDGDVWFSGEDIRGVWFVTNMDRTSGNLSTPYKVTESRPINDFFVENGSIVYTMTGAVGADLIGRQTLAGAKDWDLTPVGSLEEAIRSHYVSFDVTFKWAVVLPLIALLALLIALTSLDSGIQFERSTTRLNSTPDASHPSPVLQEVPGSNIPTDPSDFGGPLAALADAIKTAEKRATFFLWAGSVVSLLGLSVFSLAISAAENSGKSKAMAELIPIYVRSIGLLVFVEAIAIFCFRLYREAVSESGRYFERSDLYRSAQACIGLTANKIPGDKAPRSIAWIMRQVLTRDGSVAGQPVSLDPGVREIVAKAIDKIPTDSK